MSRSGVVGSLSSFERVDGIVKCGTCRIDQSVPNGELQMGQGSRAGFGNGVAHADANSDASEDTKARASADTNGRSVGSTSVPFVAHRMNMTAFPPHLLEQERELDDHVPGFAVTGWLVRYPVEQWGGEWIEHGSMEVRYRRPLHVGDQLTITVREAVDDDSPSDRGRVAQRLEFLIHDENQTAVASGWAAAPDPAKSIVHVDSSAVPNPLLRPYASALLGQSLGTLTTIFDADRDLAFVGFLGADDPWVKRRDAHPTVLAWCANVLVRQAIEFTLGQWKHAGTQSEQYRAIPDGAELRFVGRVAKTFGAGSHEFFVAEVLVEADGEASALLRLTYLCEPEPS
jgi:hypothetical protein